MDGVTILNTYMAFTRESLLLIFCACGLSVLAIIFSFVLYCENIEVGSATMLGIATFIVLMASLSISKTEHIQAVLDDSVSYTELTDKYEIVKSDGRIITMIEKEQKDNETSDDI